MTLEKLLAIYKAASAKAGVEYLCLSEDGSPADAFGVTMDGDVAQVRVTGPLDGYFGASSRDIIAALDKFEPKTINLLIDSPGGFVTEGLSLYSDLRARADKDVTISAEARGLVASAAILPYLAADVENRTMGEGSMLMVHEPYGSIFAFGNADEIESEAEKTVKAIRAFSDNYSDIVAARVSASKSDVKAAIKAETWYSSAEAVKSGYATAVSKTQDDPEATAIIAKARRRAAASILNLARAT